VLIVGDSIVQLLTQDEVLTRFQFTVSFVFCEFLLLDTAARYLSLCRSVYHTPVLYKVAKHTIYVYSIRHQVAQSL